MRLRVLTWNLTHARAAPAAGRSQLDELTAALRGWDWDVALLQEVPARWPQALGAALGAEQRSVPIARGGSLARRRALAIRVPGVPDLISSHGDGASAILARSDRIVADAALRLRRRPERRWVHGVGLAVGAWVANVHTSAHDTEAARHDLRAAADAARGWARETGGPLVLGGDLELRSSAAEGLREVAASGRDHVLVGEGVEAVAAAEVLEQGTLSDHAPLAVALEVTVWGT